MATNAEIITDALRELNVISETDSASDEQGVTGLRKLNRLMALWKTQSKDIGYFPQTTTTDDCPIPEWAELAVVTTLAIVMAPQYGATVSLELASVADGAVTAVEQHIINTRLQNTDMSHLPIGDGWFGRGYNINTGS